MSDAPLPQLLAFVARCTISIGLLRTSTNGDEHATDPYDVFNLKVDYDVSGLKFDFDWEYWRRSPCAKGFYSSLNDMGWQDRSIVGNRSTHYFKCRDMGMAFRPIVLSFPLHQYISRVNYEVVTRYNHSLAGLVRKATPFPVEGLSFCVQKLSCEKEFFWQTGGIVEDYSLGIGMRKFAAKIEKLEAHNNFWCSVLLPTFLRYRFHNMPAFQHFHNFDFDMPPPEPHECSAVFVDIGHAWQSDATYLVAQQDVTNVPSRSVAICMTGQVRTFVEPKVHLSFRQNVVESLSASHLRMFYVLNLTSVLSTATDSHTISDLQATAGAQEVLAAIAAVGLDITASIDLEPSCCWPKLLHGQVQSDCFYDQLACGAAYRSRRRCAASVQVYEHAYGFDFDWIFFMRPDLMWFFPIGDIRRFEPGILYTPSYGGYEIWDVTQLVPRKLVRVALDVWGDVEKGWNCMTHKEVKMTKCIFGSCGCKVELHMEAQGVPMRSLKRFPREIHEIVRMSVK